ncbi:bacillithiol system redox-active protein YtxJ [Cloacibacterium sp. TD35]|uniref:bacillithiol system redox-active protein YtxJ n=1 Tax=Cloacibacterium sp. TD35 TaxID=2976818 RepID=UPI00237E02C2|nr:bacillithiol system redox-active protein YtxJ [Cloacibacterium sp. TD35]WDT67396.1 bacillithiol system redox-active protein YtxJ [Cloacibacterium sp. TD35]
MSIFNNLFGGNSNVSSLKDFWNEIQSEEDLEAIVEASKKEKIVIFKHSTRCIISKTVLRNFEKQIEKQTIDLPKFYYLDLLNHRDISNEIAHKFSVAHQSPQIVVIENGHAIHNASHDNINLSTILTL